MYRVYGWGDINEKSSKGQVGLNFQQHPICMNDWYIKLFLSACTFQKYIFLSYLSFHFWNKPICLNSDHDCSGRSIKMQNGDYRLQEINNPYNSVNRLFWFCLAYDYSHQIWIWYYLVFSSNEISKKLNANISKLCVTHNIHLEEVCEFSGIRPAKVLKPHLKKLLISQDFLTQTAQCSRHIKSNIILLIWWTHY